MTARAKLCLHGLVHCEHHTTMLRTQHNCFELAQAAVPYEHAELVVTIFRDANTADAQTCT